MRTFSRFVKRHAVLAFYASLSYGADVGQPPAKEDTPMRQFLLEVISGALATVIGGWVLSQLLK